jgi:hypothetical protein
VLVLVLVRAQASWVAVPKHVSGLLLNLALPIQQS